MSDRMEAIKCCVDRWCADHDYYVIFLEDLSNTDEYVDALCSELELWRGLDDWEDVLRPYTLDAEWISGVVDHEVYIAVKELVNESPESAMLE